MTSSSKASRLGSRPDAERVLRALQEFCDSHEPGEFIPPQGQLMTDQQASERAVRWALDEMTREGKIVRRQGARAAVASPTPPESLATTVAGKTIVAVAIMEHALFEQTINSLVERAKLKQISVVCHVLPMDSIGTKSIPRLTEEPLGYVVFRRELMDVAEELHAKGHRVISLSTPKVDSIPAVPVVHGDQEEGGYLATQHLIDLGHRRIAFCGPSYYATTYRFEGHLRAIDEARQFGLEVQDSALLLEEVASWRNHPERGLALFKSPLAPTAMAAWNDHEAVMVMSQLARLGIRVPQDVSIIGYDDLPIGRQQHPALSTVRNPMDLQVKAALNLLSRPKMPPAPYQVIYAPTLIERESAIRLPH